MLEILFLIFLCRKNAANAVMLGRKPGGFIALTLCLWVGMEFLGGFIGGLADLGTGTYLLALLLAALGGLGSYLAAKNCRYGQTAASAGE